jgi:hypothetical protein
MNPTDNTYTSLNSAYEFFNQQLFDSKLPSCLITMQRKGKAYGYFSPERFETRTNESTNVHEIALNPALFKERSDAEILSTLLHEMVHLWQQEHGNPPRKSYHNKEWSSKMEEVGLVPSNTGLPDGKKTGQSMTHYIDESGKFASIIESFLINENSIIYQDRPISVIKKIAKKNKVKYSCSVCGVNAWGKPNVNIKCGDDDVQMAATE